MACLICGHHCSPHATGSFMKSNPICDEILAELHMYFVVQKLLQIPDNSCEKLVSTHGGTLSEWSTSFCLQCSCVIEEAKELSLQIVNLTSKFQCLQQKLQDKVMTLIDEGNGSLLPGLPTDLRELCHERVNFLRGIRSKPKRQKNNIDGDDEDTQEESSCSDSEASDDDDTRTSPVGGSSSSSFVPMEFSFSAMKTSPASLRDDRLIDEMSEDPAFLDPGSILQVVSDIGSSRFDVPPEIPLEPNISPERSRTDALVKLNNEMSLQIHESSRTNSTKKSEYFQKIMELHSSQAKNTVLITKDKYRKILVDLKLLRDTGKRTKFISNYYKRYELLEYMDTLTLVRSGTQKRVVAAEDLYDVINAAHLSTNHGGRDSILKYLKEEFFNVTKHQVNTFLSICEGCAVKRLRKRC